MNAWFVIAEAKCRYCGRVFVPAPYHALKDSNGLYCKPTCFLHREELYEKKKKAVIAVRGDEIKRFKSVREASDTFDSDPKTIRRACKTGERHKGYVWEYEK